MTPEEIVSRIEREEKQAYGINDSQLSGERSEAINYYLGEKFGNEVEGRSQVVSYDVQDTIESALPQLLKVFISGDEVVKFDPKSEEDTKAAEQETEYINHVVMEKNPGYAVFYSWFKDALLSKNGYVKVWYEEEDRVETESYQGLTDGQLAMVVQAEGVEVLEHTEYDDPMAANVIAQQAQMMQQQGGPMNTYMPPPIPKLHDIKIEVSKVYGCIKIDNVAPESIMVSTDTKAVSVQNSRFVQHRENMSKADIEAQGWEVPEGAAEESDKFMEESNARDLYSEDEISQYNGYLVRDTYYRIDGKLKRYVVIGNKVVHEEDAEIIPFAVITPMIMPHRHIGRSYADLTKDIQLIKSTMIRGQLDNMYLSNNGRHFISDRVNVEDMLVSRPGGLVRVQGQDVGGAFAPLQHTPFPPSSFTMIEFLDSMKEKRTGVTAYNQGLDSNSLNKTATGVMQIMSAAAQRLELVARTFAETGVKELFMLTHRLVRKYYTKPDIVRLRNEWVEVDPRAWKNRQDLSVSVGLGTGNKDQQLMHLEKIIQSQLMGLQVGVATPENLYNSLSKLTQNAGFKNPEMFWTDPKKAPKGPPKPDPEAMKMQGQMQIEQMKLQAKEKEIAMNAQAEQQKAQMQLQHEQVRSQNDVTIHQADAQAKIELERWKAELEAETALKKAQMELEAKMQIEAMKASAPQHAPVSINNDPNGDFAGAIKDVLMSQQEQHQALIAALTRPKMIVRGKDGRAVGVQ